MHGQKCQSHGDKLQLPSGLEMKVFAIKGHCDKARLKVFAIKDIMPNKHEAEGFIRSCHNY
jgi:hypothetical protein